MMSLENDRLPWVGSVLARQCASNTPFKRCFIMRIIFVDIVKKEKQRENKRNISRRRKFEEAHILKRWVSEEAAQERLGY